MRKHCYRNILSQCCSQCCMGAQTGKKQNILLPRRKVCVFKIFCLGTQTRKHPGNIQSQCFFSVSHVIPRLLPHAIYVEDTKSASWKQKMLLRFSKNIFCVLDAFLFPQQFFLVCAGCKKVPFSRYLKHVMPPDTEWVTEYSWSIRKRFLQGSENGRAKYTKRTDFKWIQSWHANSIF